MSKVLLALRNYGIHILFLHLHLAGLYFFLSSVFTFTSKKILQAVDSAVCLLKSGESEADRREEVSFCYRLSCSIQSLFPTKETEFCETNKNIHFCMR